MLMWCSTGWCALLVGSVRGMCQSLFISAPLENSRSFAGDHDVIVVMDHCTLVAFMENADISIAGKGADAEG